MSMTLGLGVLGKKIGMEQLFDAEGNRIPVTLVEAGPCVVTQIKTQESDGYNAIQVAFGEGREKRFNKPSKGHFTKAKVTPRRFVREFKVAADVAKTLQLGQEIGCEHLQTNEFVDVTGVSKGKGFAGVIKRHGMKGFPATHGTHEYFRHGGSIGCRFPQGTIKGLRMPGHLGTDRVTVQNLKLMEIKDGGKPGQKILAIEGAVPGNRGGFLVVRKAIKKAAK